jgi:type I restriction enzyme R subunit
MTEFKQIIGRGTRINEDYGKLWFTIMDFRRATALFADPAFDGDPVQVYEPGPNDPPVPPEVEPEPPDGDEEGPEGGEESPDWDGATVKEGRTKYYVDDVEVRVLSERVQYLGADGRLITESLKDYTRKTVRSSYASLGEFLNAWTATERKVSILDELTARGVFFEDLAALVGAELDAFDLICHVAFDQPPLTRRERAERVRKRNVFGKYGDPARAVLEALLEKYADTGLESVESLDILRVQPLRGMGTPLEIIGRFGGKPEYQAAIRELESALYSKDA